MTLRTAFETRLSVGTLHECEDAQALATATAPVVAPTFVNASGSWWEVYFTDPQNINNFSGWQGSIEGRLIEKINTAQSSIHIASFEFDLTPVAEALIAAKQRGVDVRWVTDDESGLEADEEPDRGQLKCCRMPALRSARIPVLP